MNERHWSSEAKSEAGSRLGRATHLNSNPVLSVNQCLQAGLHFCICKYSPSLICQSQASNWVSVVFFCNRESIHTQELIYCDALISFSYFTQHNYELAADVWRCTYNIYPPHNPVIGARLVSRKIILHKLVFISDSLCKLTQTSFLHYGFNMASSQ